MAAGLGFKTFTTGEVLTAADTNGYLMQGILVFASAAARDAAITSPQEGQACYLKDTDATLTYSGSTWVAVGSSGDVTGVTAGTGITVTDPTGPVPTVTNSMATAIDAKGDLVPGTGADAFSRLAVGANDLLLTADSAQATGLKYTGSWTTWTPTYGSFSLGNGTVTARYCQIGKVMFWDFKVVFGSTTSITGSNPYFDLPKAAVTPVFYFDGNILDNGIANYNASGQGIATSTIVYWKITNVAGTYPTPSAVSSTTPMTWGTLDEFQLHGFCEVA
jgi:hypothetical protein